MQIINIESFSDPAKDKIKDKIQKGLKLYLSIMGNLPCGNPVTEDFRRDFYRFYLRSGSRTYGAAMDKRWNPLYDCLTQIGSGSSLRDIVTKLSEALSKNIDHKRLEFSFATKLLHTVNPDKPIYDSRVTAYLHKFGNDEIKSGRIDNWKRRDDDIERRLKCVEDDYARLCRWYNDFLETGECQKWCAQFDSWCDEWKAESGKTIKPVKKIDFLIWAWK